MGDKPTRIFLDSNVIISGLYSDKGAPRIILDILSLRLPFIAGVTGKYNIIEIERNLEKKMPDAISVYRKYLPLLDLDIIPMPSVEDVRRASGEIAEKDIPVLLSAIEGKVDILVTGDRKDFEKLKVGQKYNFRILTPSELTDLIIPDILNKMRKT